MQEPTLELVRRAVAGDARAIRQLVGVLTPIVQRKAARALLRRRAAAGPRDVRQELEDLVQAVFEALFAGRARALLAWDPARGASFEGFVGLVAEREIASILRSRKRSPRGEEPTSTRELDAQEAPAPEVEARIESADQLERIYERLRERLTPRGLDLFAWLVVEGRSVEDVCELAGMTPDAVYAWRSRLGRLARSIAVELARGGGDAAVSSRPA